MNATAVSAAAWLDPMPVAPGAAPRHLRLVRCADAFPMHKGGDRPPPQLRLTRRGRLTITLSAICTLLAMTALAIALVSPASGAGEVVVRPGQTLSEIAATHRPDLPLDRAIVQIQLRNNMNTAHVQAGQTISLP